MLSVLSLECTSEATLHCGSAPLNAAPLQAPLWRAGVCYGGASCARQTGSSAGSLCEARQHMKTAFDMCLNITSGRPRWSRLEEEECHEVKSPFCKCGSGGRECGSLLLWVQLEEGADLVALTLLRIGVSSWGGKRWVPRLVVLSLYAD